MLELTMPDSAEADQDALVEAFTAGAIEGLTPPVEHVQTHLNHVFLAGARAFKLKRAVRLPFVDFRTPDRRRAACEAEVSVNTALGSPFYVGVVPVVRTATNALALGGDGVVEDWVVEMRRFDRRLQFDVMAGEGVLSVEMVEAATSAIVDMHRKAPVTQLAGHTADYRQTIRLLERTEADAASRLGLQMGLPSPFEALDRELARISAIIEKRRRAGGVRRVHGDLHLRNICLFEGRPVPFDALEFDERMGTIDVLYDLAFLLMDLRHAGLPRHANAAMNRYWDEAGEDEEGLAVLPFFMALRAAVRMAVAVAEGSLEDAQKYRALAFSFLSHNQGLLIAIGGLSGAGKSAAAREVAYRLPGPAGARLLRSDVLRKRALGLPLDQHAGDDVYAPEKRAEVYRGLAARAAVARGAGASVIVDATFRVASARAALQTIHSGFRGFWLDVPVHVRLARIAGRKNDASDAGALVAMSQSEPGDLGSAWRRVSGRRSVPEIASEILSEITSAPPGAPFAVEEFRTRSTSACDPDPSATR